MCVNDRERAYSELWLFQQIQSSTTIGLKGVRRNAL